MMTIAIIKGIRTIFTTHVYRYGGKYFLEVDRGPIGHVITCSVARLIMIWWNQKYLELLTTLGLVSKEGEEKY